MDKFDPTLSQPWNMTCRHPMRFLWVSIIFFFCCGLFQVLSCKKALVCMFQVVLATGIMPKLGEHWQKLKFTQDGIDHYFVLSIPFLQEGKPCETMPQIKGHQDATKQHCGEHISQPDKIWKWLVVTSKLQKTDSLKVSLHLNNLDQATCMLHPVEKPSAVRNSYLGNQSKSAKAPN